MHNSQISRPKFTEHFYGIAPRLLLVFSETCLGHVRENGQFLGHVSEQSRRRPGQVPEKALRKNTQVFGKSKNKNEVVFIVYLYTYYQLLMHKKQKYTFYLLELIKSCTFVVIGSDFKAKCKHYSLNRIEMHKKQLR